MKLSVIVPVYNGEKYVARCLDSILAQVYNNKTIEIIVVDDGSQDLTLPILENYRSQYPRLIKIIRQPNGGVSVARNSGFELASGEYIWFVDSDDVICDGALEKIFKALEFNCADYYIFHAYAVDQKGSTIDEFRHKLPIERICKLEFTYDNCLKYFSKNMPFTKVLKREFVVNCRFPQGLTHEDIYYDLIVISKIPKICGIDSFIYKYYFYNTESITNTMNIEKFLHVLMVFEKLKKNLTLKNEIACISKLAVHRLFKRMLYIKTTKIKGKRNLIYEYNKFIANEIIHNKIRIREFKVGKIEKIALFFIRYRIFILSNIINSVISRY